jgi:hypothetical protein
VIDHHWMMGVDIGSLDDIEFDDDDDDEDPDDDLDI